MLNADQYMTSRWPRRSALALWTIGLGFTGNAKAENAQDLQFDIQAMQVRGIDPRLADWFRQAPRFMPGESTVALTVNGSARGKVKATFNNEGRLCANQSFQKQAGLMPPPGYDESATCFDLKTAWPQTEFNLDPGEERIDLVVPPQAVANPGVDSGNWNHGGTAGMLNYDAQYLDAMGASAGMTFMQLATEAGFNAGDWIVRSRQTFTRFNGEDSMRHQAAYAQRTFADIKKVIQAGQVSLSNSMFGTGQVLGFQMFPEAALQRSQGGPGLVEGIADSQSVIEVRQSGALVYSTTVPAGPFRLQGFPLLNTRSDLAVTLTGSEGNKREFTVPASALLLNGNAVVPGWSFGAGKLDQQGNSEAPVLGTVANGWVLTPHTTLNAGLLGSAPYQAGAIGLGSQLFNGTLMSLQGTVAQDTEQGNKGVSATANLSHNLTERISVNANARQQTSGYRELSDALQNNNQNIQGRSRNQIGGGVGWSTEHLGNLSLSWARSNTFDGDSTYYMRGGWSKTFGRAYVGISLEHDTGTRYTDSDDRLYATVSIPFGQGKSASSFLNSSRKNTRAGVRYSDRSDQDSGWSLSGERDFRNSRVSGTGAMDLITSVSQLSGSVTRDSNNYTSWSGRASGAVVAHESGVTLSPFRISDTFGIAKVGDEAGVRLDTPSGPTWTDGRGYAVLPSLNGYKRSAIQVDTRSLARNVDIGNAWQETEAARGSVNYMNFDVVRTRRVLISVKDDQGEPIPHGASVFDDSGNFVTVVGDKGSVFVPDASNVGKLDVQTSGKTLCTFTLTMPEKADNSALYETAFSVCR